MLFGRFIVPLFGVRWIRVVCKAGAGTRPQPRVHGGLRQSIPCCGPWSTHFGRTIKVEEGQQGQAQRLRDSEQVQVGRIPAPCLQPADVGTVQVTFRRQFFLRPVSGKTKAANPLAESSERGV
jgi:hypothetical protein